MTDETLPALDPDRLQELSVDRLFPDQTEGQIKILILYGSLREMSYSKALAEECGRLLRHLGAETLIYDPDGLPQPDCAPETHPKVAELRDAALWCDGFVWVSPERHGAMTGVIKSQIDWIPLSTGGVRPTQGKTLAVLQVNGGLAKLQYSEPAAHPWPLDAAFDHPEPILCANGVGPVQKRAHEAFTAL